MPRLLAAFAALALLVPAAASAQYSARIVGGQPASPGEYPFYALLEIAFPDGSNTDEAPDGEPDYARCGAALIAARYLITAGHCTDWGGTAPLPGGITAYLNDVNLNDGVSAANTYDGITFEPGDRHPSFVDQTPSGPILFDLAVLELPRPAFGIEQLRLPRPADAGSFPPGTTATGIGFGATGFQGESSSELREVLLPIVPDSECSFVHGYSADLMLCAGGQFGRDTCQGDSGGPLLAPDGQRHILAGLVSFGPPCAQGVPAVYADTTADPLNSFIRAHVPQVEISASPSQPEPGQPVTLTAVGSNPNGAYTSFTWDLDGDGTFGDVTGTTATKAFPQGRATVAVRAVRDQGNPDETDEETRRVDLDVRYRSPVGFTAANASGPEGGAVAVTVTRSAGVPGTGTVVLTPSLGSSTVTSFTATTLSFAPGQASQTVNVPLHDDTLDEPDQQFRLELTAHAGDLLPGSPGQIVVTVTDNDLPPSVRFAGKSTQKVKRGAVALTVPVTGTGTLVLALRDSRGRALARSVTRNVLAPGTLKVSLKLTASGRRALRRANRRKGLRAKAVATYMPTGSPTPLSARRNITLKR